MVRNRPPLLIAGLMTLVFAACLFAHGQVWDFLGYTQIDGNRDYSNIQITRRDHVFRTIQLRVSGDAVFFDHLLLHFGDSSDQDVIVSARISPEQQEYLINLPREGHALEPIELFYFKESSQHNTRVSLYGLRLPDPTQIIGGER